MRRTALTGLAVFVVTLIAPVRSAEAAGITTHAWMAIEAVDLVSDAQLEALLRANIGQLEGGAQFPDSGYWNRAFDVDGGDYGEEAHWQRFFDAYADQIRNDSSCGDLTRPDGPCAPRIAHLMGAMAHGMGDEVWDWLFEPRAPDFGESYIPPALESFFGTGGAELQMDIIAIHDHGRQTSPDTPPADLADVFASIGRGDITVDGLLSGKNGMSIVRGAEPVLTALYQDAIHQNMPQTAAGLVTAPGGIDFAAGAIAGEYENLWGRLLGHQPATEVGATYPADGETDVPATGWDRATFLPGASPGRGGARNRITAALTYSLPYVPLAGSSDHVPSLLPAGSMTLREAATGDLVPVKSGYPRIVPYTPDPGEHTIDIQPAANLAPCTEYRVDVTDHLLDANGDPVVPTSWTFRTEGCPGEVAGTVSEAGSGDPVVGAFVAVLDTSDFSIAAGGVAAGSGGYTVEVPAGSYFVYVLDPSGAHTAGFFGAPTQVTVTAGNVADADPLLVSTRGSVVSSVTETVTGNPIPGAWGLALSASVADTGATERAVTADGAGDLVLSGLVPGNHFLGFVDPSGAHASRFWPGSPNVPDSTPVAVTAANATTADVMLPAQAPTATGATIAGTVTESGTGTPVAGARVVALRASDFAMVRGATADANGGYRLDVAPGEYKLAVLDGDGLHAMEWFDDQPNTGLGEAATVTAPRAGVDAALAATTGTMAGTIVDDPSGDPLEGVWVVAIGPSGIAGGAVTAADGSYTVDGLAPGTYRVTFADPNGGRTQEYYDDSPDYDGATPVNIVAANTVTIDAALALP